MIVTLSAVGAASAELAWERYMDTRLWSQWAPQIERVDTDSDTTRLTTGATGTVTGPVGLAVRFVVDDVDEPARTWRWHAWWQKRFLGLKLRHAVTDHPQGCRTTLQIDGSFALVVPYAPIAELALRQLVKG